MESRPDEANGTRVTNRNSSLETWYSYSYQSFEAAPCANTNKVSSSDHRTKLTRTHWRVSSSGATLTAPASDSETTTSSQLRGDSGGATNMATRAKEGDGK